MNRTILTKFRQTKKEKATLKKKARARGKDLGFEGESAYIRWLIENDNTLILPPSMRGPG